MSNISIQDGKGNVLIQESFQARFDQLSCDHKWIVVGHTKECPKCLSVKTIKK